jgi:hypothetical protein
MFALRERRRERRTGARARRRAPRPSPTTRARSGRYERATSFPAEKRRAARDRLLRFYASTRGSRSSGDGHHKVARAGSSDLTIRCWRASARYAALPQGHARLMRRRRRGPPRAARPLADRPRPRPRAHHALLAAQSRRGIAEVTAAATRADNDDRARAEIPRSGPSSTPTRARRLPSRGRSRSARARRVHHGPPGPLGGARACSAGPPPAGRFRGRAVGGTLRPVDDILAQTGEPDRSRRDPRCLGGAEPQDIARAPGLLALDSAARALARRGRGLPPSHRL